VGGAGGVVGECQVVQQRVDEPAVIVTASDVNAALCGVLSSLSLSSFVIKVILIILWSSRVMALVVWEARGACRGMPGRTTAR
jgi:hypothetical protein